MKAKSDGTSHVVAALKYRAVFAEGASVVSGNRSVFGDLFAVAFDNIDNLKFGNSGEWFKICECSAFDARCIIHISSIPQIKKRTPQNVVAPDPFAT